MNSRLLEKLHKLKKEKRAVILAHNYQLGEVQDIADFCGDSLGLSIEASKTDADVIVFCGVKFMAETAKILSPAKTVLLPEASAGCPMADMITAADVRQLRSQYPDALVVTYVNSSAEVKAESDYCCTSSNALKLVKSLPADRRIVFVPDRNLGGFVKERSGRDIVLWPGYCNVHVRILPEDVAEARAEHPEAVVLAHPECTEPVRRMADELLSTGQMLAFARRSKARSFIIATETGIIHTLKKENPGAEFYAAAAKAVCPNMKKITLEKVVEALENMQTETFVEPTVSAGAKKALDRMVEVVP